MKMIKTFAILLLLTLSTYAQAGLFWAGCGITKKAFMSELALAYEKETGIDIELEGGGATRGVRGVVHGT